MRSAPFLVLTAILAAPVLTGCGDKKVEETQSRSTNPFTGTRTTRDQTTYQRGDGSTYTDTQTRHSN